MFQIRTLRRIKALKSAPSLAGCACCPPPRVRSRTSERRAEPSAILGPLSNPIVWWKPIDGVGWCQLYSPRRATGARQSCSPRKVRRGAERKGYGVCRVSRNVAAGVTTREQRVSRGTTADGEGKALKTEILWAEVAWNKATRLGREQTAERVRNPESGWYSWGKAVLSSPALISPKGLEPQGRSRQWCPSWSRIESPTGRTILEKLCPSPWMSIFRGWTPPWSMLSDRVSVQAPMGAITGD